MSATTKVADMHVYVCISTSVARLLLGGSPCIAHEHNLPRLALEQDGGSCLCDGDTRLQKVSKLLRP